MNPKTKKILKIILIIPLTLLLLVGIVFGGLTIVEYNPKDEETLEVDGTYTQTVSIGDTLSVLTWNIGYGGLDETADFFMDGGHSVQSADEETVKEDVNAVIDEISTINPDIVLLQEVDRDSKRSYYMDEYEMILSSFNQYEATFANNHKVAYVPYPIPPIGKVDAGLMTLSSYEVSDSKRIALPCPFKWPIRIANLKRCLMVNRIPIEGSDKELVVINLHLEAYDDGEGKIEQTKQLKKVLEQEASKGNYVIAGGDFNQSFSNYDISAYPTISDDIWAPGVLDVSEFDADLLTFVSDYSYPTARSLDRTLADAESKDPQDFQYFAIDGFIVSNNINVESIVNQNLEFKNSDHNPLLMEVTLEK